MGRPLRGSFNVCLALSDKAIMRPGAFQVAAITQTPGRRAQKANYAPIKAHTHKSVWEVRLAGL